MGRLPSTTPVQLAERKENFLAVLRSCDGILKDACDTFDISRRAVYNWRNNDPAFAAEIEQIRADVDAELAEEMESIMIALARGETTKENIPHFQAAKHIASVTAPSRHGDKMSHDHSGVVIHIAAPEAKRIGHNRRDILDIIPTLAAIESGDEEEDE